MPRHHAEDRAEFEKLVETATQYLAGMFSEKAGFTLIAISTSDRDSTQSLTTNVDVTWAKNAAKWASSRDWPEKENTI